MFTLHRDRGRSPISPGPRLVEWLECRTLLSATGFTVHPNYEVLRYAATGAPVGGYTPAQIRHAYGFDRVSFGSGSSAADGRGQTIAIVDAYAHPNIVNDLKVFDQQFGLPDPPSIKVVNQQGGTNLPATEPGWAGEIALDVEWSHAIAPGAKILLVEASSSTTDDLLAAVDMARNAPGVTVVSMSWGGGEAQKFVGREFAAQTGYDNYFTTPTGHAKVTFIASSGDDGPPAGALWPASSPNVMSVGGTSLTTSDNAGTYGGETPWDGSSGGYSNFETEPNYQRSVQATRARSVPDVSYDGDPQTGFAIYDSVPDYDGNSGWAVVGGTSAGAPQWASLMAIANQGRALAGKGSLDGVNEALPLLYSFYNTTNTAGSANYPIYFNDVPSVVGYDTTTGLGSPKANAVISAMVAATFAPSTSGSGSTGSTGSNGGAPGEVIGDGSGSGPTGGGSGSTQTPTPTPSPTSPTPTPTAPPPPSPVKAVFAPKMPPSMIAGQDRPLKLRLTNTGGYRYAGPVNVTVFASSDAIVSSDDATIATASLPQASFRPRASKKLKLKLSFPSTLPNGAYYFVAQVAATDTQTTPAVTATTSAMQIAPGHVDLAATFGDTPISVDPGRKASTTVSIQNLGNVTAAGPLDLGLYASSDDQYDTLDELLAQLPTRALKLKPGRSITLHLHFTAPADQTAGSYSLLAVTKPAAALGDSDSSNDIAVATTV